jgi:hypothetical protein
VPISLVHVREARREDQVDRGAALYEESPQLRIKQLKWKAPKLGF